MKLHVGTALAILHVVTSSIRIIDGRLTTKPENVEVKVGDRVQINCSTSEKPNVVWKKSTDVSSAGSAFVYDHGRLLVPFSDRFQMDRDNTSGRYNLIITSVRKEDAGTYICIDQAGQGEEAKAELIVLDSGPHCVALDVYFCEETEKIIDTSCTVHYAGNIVPEVECSGSEVYTVNSKLIEQEQNKVVYSLPLRGHGSVGGTLNFSCFTMMSRISSNTSNFILEVAYAFGADAFTERQSNIAVCQVNTSESECQYEWFDNNTGSAIKTGHTLSAVIGTYYCNATCLLHGHTCQMISRLVEMPIPDQEAPTNAGIIAGAVVGILVSMAIGLPIGIIVYMKRHQICRRDLEGDKRNSDKRETDCHENNKDFNLQLLNGKDTSQGDKQRSLGKGKQQSARLP